MWKATFSNTLDFSHPAPHHINRQPTLHTSTDLCLHLCCSFVEESSPQLFIIVKTLCLWADLLLPLHLASCVCSMPPFLFSKTSLVLKCANVCVCLWLFGAARVCFVVRSIRSQVHGLKLFDEIHIACFKKLWQMGRDQTYLWSPWSLLLLCICSNSNQSVFCPPLMCSQTVRR